MLAAILLLPVLAGTTSVSGVRDSPVRLAHNLDLSQLPDPVPVPSPPPAVDLSVPDAPNTKVRSRTAWIKEYLAFSSRTPAPPAEDTTTPLSSKFTNLDRTLSDEDDLRSWTRYVVGTSAEDAGHAPQKQESLDVEVADFADYLVRHHGFSGADLRFLYTLNCTYDEIESRLDAIRAGVPQENTAASLKLHALLSLLPLALL